MGHWLEGIRLWVVHQQWGCWKKSFCRLLGVAHSFLHHHLTWLLGDLCGLSLGAWYGDLWLLLCDHVLQCSHRLLVLRVILLLHFPKLLNKLFHLCPCIQFWGPITCNDEFYYHCYGLFWLLFIAMWIFWPFWWFLASSIQWDMDQCLSLDWLSPLLEGYLDGIMDSGTSALPMAGVAKLVTFGAPEAWATILSCCESSHICHKLLKMEHQLFEFLEWDSIDRCWDSGWESLCSLAYSPCHGSIQPFSYLATFWSLSNSLS